MPVRNIHRCSSEQILIWERFEEQGDKLLEDAMRLLSDYAAYDEGPDGTAKTYLLYRTPEGKDRLVEVTARVNQGYFRNTLLETYGGRCCATGLAVPQLLVASHIKPWSAADPREERLAPDNGLLLNALHDRAFDRGLMTIDADLRIRVSRKVGRDNASERMLWVLDGKEITPPKRHRPRREFIEYHNDVVFKG